MRYTGPILKYPKVEFGIISLPDFSHFVFVTANIKENKAYVIGYRQNEVSHDVLQKFALNCENMVREFSSANIVQKNISALVEYMRSLPRGCKSELLFSEEDGVRNTALQELSLSLVRSLLNEDAFRAAVELEAITPFLRGDVRLVALMGDLIAKVEDDLSKNRTRYLIKACSGYQRDVVHKLSFLNSKIVDMANYVFEEDKSLRGP